MQRMLLILLMPAMLLFQSCAGTSSLIDETKVAVKDAAVVAKAAKDAVTSIKDGMKKPDGTTDTSSGAWIGAILGALPAAWIAIKQIRDAKKEHADTRDALNAVADAIDSAPAEHAAPIRTLAAANPKMHAGAMVAVAKARSR